MGKQRVKRGVLFVSLKSKKITVSFVLTQLNSVAYSIKIAFQRNRKGESFFETNLFSCNNRSMPLGDISDKFKC